MKTMKIAAAAVLIIAALALVTCDGFLLPPGKDGDVEYTDVVYSDDGRYITLYLDGVGVPLTRAQRALSTELAKMSHDYFEAVFVSGGFVARAAWEIGQPAGINGVPRDVNYKQVSGDPAAVIFAGKKNDKTLMGIGHVVGVGPATGAYDYTSTEIESSSVSVTFGVYPLITEGLGFSDPNVPNNPTPFSIATGRMVTLQAGVTYPVFTLTEPAVKGTKINATYTFRNLAVADTILPSPVSLVKPDDLFTATILAAPLEIIKRVPSFIFKGQTYEAMGEVIDMYTTVEPTNNDNVGDAFENPITMTFTQDGPELSIGLFAITFQVPVYAITDASSNNNAAIVPVKWYIRPGYNQYNYLLDDGKAAGGMVMLGTSLSGSDWLNIFTVGIGFSN